MADKFGPYDQREEAAAPDSKWAAKRILAKELRRMAGLVVTSDVDEKLFDQVTVMIREQADRLAAQPQLPGKMAHVDKSVELGSDEYRNQRNVPSHELSPIVGLANPVSPPLNMWFEGEQAHARVTMGWQFEGPPGCVHGGYVAALFDDFLGSAQKLTTQPGLTGTLKVRYIKPTPLNQELELIGWVDKIAGRKNTIVGELRSGGELKASCEGLFIAITPAQYKTLGDDSGHSA